MESIRYNKNSDVTNANVNYSTIDSNVSTYGNIWIDNYNDTGKWAYLENGTVIREQEDLTDPRFVDKIITYESAHRSNFDNIIKISKPYYLKCKKEGYVFKRETHIDENLYIELYQLVNKIFCSNWVFTNFP